MDDLETIIKEITSDEDARYFYHITSEGGEKILEEGLIVANSLWFQSFLEFNDEEKENIYNVINNNINNKVKNAKSIIIAGVYKEDMPHFIRKLRDDETFTITDWQGVGAPDYIVDSNYLVGYIDLDTFEFKPNENSYVLQENDYLDL